MWPVSGVLNNLGSRFWKQTFDIRFVPGLNVVRVPPFNEDRFTGERVVADDRCGNIVVVFVKNR